MSSHHTNLVSFVQLFLFCWIEWIDLDILMQLQLWDKVDFVARNYVLFKRKGRFNSRWHTAIAQEGINLTIVMKYPMILPISDPNGCYKLHPTQPPTLARLAQNIGFVSQNEGLNRSGQKTAFSKFE